MGRHPKRGHFSRSRSLEDFNKRFKSLTIEKIVEEALNRKKKSKSA